MRPATAPSSSSVDRTHPQLRNTSAQNLVGALDPSTNSIHYSLIHPAADDGRLAAAASSSSSPVRSIDSPDWGDPSGAADADSGDTDALVQTLLARRGFEPVTVSAIVVADTHECACLTSVSRPDGAILLTRAALDRAMNEHGVSVVGPDASNTSSWTVRGEDHSTHILAVPDIPADLNDLHSTGLWWEGERFRAIRPFMAFCEGWVTSWWYGALVTVLVVAQLVTVVAYSSRNRSSRSIAATRPTSYTVVLAIKTAAVALMLPFMRWSMVRRCLGFDLALIVLLFTVLTVLSVIASTEHDPSPSDGDQLSWFHKGTPWRTILRLFVITFSMVVLILADGLRFPASHGFVRRIFGRRIVVSPKAVLLGNVSFTGFCYAVIQTLGPEKDHVYLRYEYLRADLTAFGAFVDFTIAVFAGKLVLRSLNGGLGARSLEWKVFRLQAQLEDVGLGIPTAVVRLVLRVPSARDVTWKIEHIVACMKWEQAAGRARAARRATAASGYSLVGARSTAASDDARVLVVVGEHVSPTYETTLVVPPAIKLYSTAPLLTLPACTRPLSEWRHFGFFMIVAYSAGLLCVLALHYAVFFSDHVDWSHRGSLIPKLINSLLCGYAVVHVPRSSVGLCVRSFDFWVMLWWLLAIVISDVWVLSLVTKATTLDMIAVAWVPVWIATDFVFGLTFLDHHPRFGKHQRALIACIATFGLAAYAVMHQLLLLRKTPSRKSPTLAVTVFDDVNIGVTTIAQGARLLMCATLFKYAFRYVKTAKGEHRFATVRCTLREVPRCVTAAPVEYAADKDNTTEQQHDVDARATP